MASLSLKNVYKVYNNKVTAVSDFSMDIEDKEFIVFVGPSGCGKSTTLRMIAGLEEITSGELYIDGKLVNDVEPSNRDIAMVFQNYALYPHMTVYENIAFGLKIKKLPKDEIDRRVHEAAKILGMEEYLNRKPKQLSGGQRQRVALGRAIVRKPKVFLLDEPLSNLDAKLRGQMRTEITKLHKKIGTTFIYVTHDQVEAMTMGTRIVVMKDGFIQQIDTPCNLYNEPVNKYVAGFIGTPQMNFFEGRLEKNGNIIFANNQSMILPKEILEKFDKERIGDGVDIVMGVRPEDLTVVDDGIIECRVEVLEELGSESLVYCNLDLEDTNQINSENTEFSLVVKTTARCGIQCDTIIHLNINLNNLHLFDRNSGVSLLTKYSDYAVTKKIQEEEKIKREQERIAMEIEENKSKIKVFIKKIKKFAEKRKQKNDE